MPKEKNLQKPENKPVNNSGGTNKSFFAFIILVIIGAYLVYHNEDKIIGNQSKNPTIPSSSTTESGANKTEEAPINNGYSVGHELHAPDYSPNIDEDDEELDELNPYDADLEIEDYKSFGPAIPKQTILRKAAEYRVFLANTHALLEKFKEGEQFGPELEQIKKRIMPEEISTIIADLDEYNKLLANKDLKPYRELNLGFEFLNNLFKIKQENPEYAVVINLKQKIDSEISVLFDFIYSEEFMNKLFNQ